jgi:hypothetical protein
VTSPAPGCSLGLPSCDGSRAMPEDPTVERALAVARLDQLIELTERQIGLLCFAIAIRRTTGRDCTGLERLVLSSQRRLREMIVQRKKLSA